MDLVESHVHIWTIRDPRFGRHPESDFTPDIEAAPADLFRAQEQIGGVRAEIGSVRAELHQEIGKVHEKIGEVHREITVQTLWLVTVMVAATVLIPVFQKLLGVLVP